MRGRDEEERHFQQICRIEAEKLQRSGEVSFIVWSLLLFLGFVARWEWS